MTFNAKIIKCLDEYLLVFTCSEDMLDGVEVYLYDIFEEEVLYSDKQKQGELYVITLSTNNIRGIQKVKQFLLNVEAKVLDMPEICLN